MNLVSVIVPTYNRANFLPDLLESVRAQTNAPIEVLVVDDGSTDNTRSVIRRCASDSGEEISVRYFYQSNQGAPAARNRGITEARGDFVQFLDSDDLLHPQKLEVQVGALRRYPDADAVWGEHQFFQNGETPDLRTYDKGVLLNSASAEIITRPGRAGHPEGALYRHEAISQIGLWNENLERWQDWEYAFRIAALRLKSVRLSEPFYFLREHDAGKIGDRAQASDAVEVCLRTLSAIDEVIAEEDGPRSALHRTAFRLYVNVLYQAFHTSLDEEIRRCIRGARAHCTTAERRFRLNVLQKIYESFGSGAARSALNIYSLLNTGAGPAGVGSA